MTTTPDRRTAPERTSDLDLGASQVAASALAAVSASLAASVLGVAGTIIGAGVGAVIATIGTAVYKHSLTTASDRLRDLRVTSALTASAGRPGGTPAAGSVAGAPGPVAHVQPGTVPGHGPTSRSGLWWRALLLVAAGAALALGAITAVEAVIGRPVSGGTSDGTSVGTVFDPADSSSTTPAPPSSTPTPTASPTDSPSATPSGSPSATATQTPSASPTETAEPSLTPTSEATEPAPTSDAPTEPATPAPTDRAADAEPAGPVPTDPAAS